MGLGFGFFFFCCQSEAPAPVEIADANSEAYTAAQEPPVEEATEEAIIETQEVSDMHAQSSIRCLQLARLPLRCAA